MPCHYNIDGILIVAGFPLADQRQLNPECTALAGLAFEIQLPVHHFNQPPADGQSKICTFHLALPGIKTVEGLEHFGLTFGWDARAGVTKLG